MTIILLRRSNSSGSVPPSGSLQFGELAINIADGGLYYHNSSSDTVGLVRAQGTSTETSETASYILGSGVDGAVDSAISASYAETSSYALNADAAIDFSTGSYTGSFTGEFFGVIESASYAETSSYAVTASYVSGTTVGSSESSSYALTASFAQRAATVWEPVTSATFADSALTANAATTADSATSASFAQDAYTQWTNVSGVPSGIVSSSTQLEGSFLEIEGDGVISSSQQFGPTDTFNVGSITASFTGTFEGTASYAQYAGAVLGGTQNAETASYVLGEDVVGAVELANTASYILASNIDGTIESASFADSALTANVATSASDVAWNDVRDQPIGLVSSSTQINNIESASYALTSSFANRAKTVWEPVTSATFANSALTANSATTAETATSASFAQNALTANSATAADSATSASFAQDAYTVWTNISSIPSGLVSSSAQIEGDFLNTEGDNVISSSQQFTVNDVFNVGSVTASFTGTLEGTSSFAISSDSASYILASNVDGTIESASYALTSSYALNAGVTNTGSYTGSFTGEFSGIGTNVTGIISSSYAETASYADRAQYFDQLLAADVQVPIATYSGSYYSGSLRFWVKADVEPNIVTDGAGAVSRWEDLSGNGDFFTQSVASKQPILYPASSGTFNLPFVRFDGTNDSLVSTLLTALTGSGEALYPGITIGMLLALGSVSASTNEGVVSFRSSSLTAADNQTSEGFVISRDATEYGWRVERDSVAHSTNLYYQQVIPYVLRIDGQYMHIWQGTEVDSFADSELSLEIDTIALGTRLFLANAEALFSKLDLVEFIVYDIALAPGEIDQLRNYLAQRAGINLAIPPASGSAETASYILGSGVDGAVELANTASYILGSNVDGTVESASFADSALTANSASFASDAYAAWTNLSGIPSGLVSSSTQIEGDFLNTEGDQVISSSAQFTVTDNFVVGQVDAVGVTASFTGTLEGTSSFAQDALNAVSALTAETASFAEAIYGTNVQGTVESASYALTASYAERARSSSYADAAGSTGGAVGGSGTPDYIAKWGGATTLTDSSLIDDGTEVRVTTPLTGSQITASIGFKGDGSQITGVITASYAETASAATSITFVPETASFAQDAYANWTNISNIPIGLLSSSTQLEGDFLSIEGDGVISSSTQFTPSDNFDIGQVNVAGLSGSLTGTLEGTASFANFADSVLGGIVNADTASFILGSNVFGAVDDAISASFAQNALTANSATTAATATSASFAGDAYAIWTNISSIPVGLVSSSNQLSNVFLEITGDNVISSSAQLTGTFLEIVGDGVVSSSTQINNIESASYALTSSFASRAATVWEPVTSATFADSALTANSATTSTTASYGTTPFIIGHNPGGSDTLRVAGTISASAIRMNADSEIRFAGRQMVASDGNHLYLGSVASPGGIVLQGDVNQMYPSSASYTDLGLAALRWKTIYTKNLNVSGSIYNEGNITLAGENIAGSTGISIRSAENQDAYLNFGSGSITRWIFYRAGTNNNFYIAHYDSAGSFTGSAVMIESNTKYITFSDRIRWGGGNYILSSNDVLLTEGFGVVSSSAQINNIESASYALTASFADRAKTVWEPVTSSSYAVTASYASTALSASYAANGGGAPGSSFTWTKITADQTGSADNGYLSSGSAQLKIYLPATSAVGDTIAIMGVTPSGWRLAQGPSQTIHYGLYSTTAGEAGYIESNNQRDTVEIICVETDTEWQVKSGVGNITIN